MTYTLHSENCWCAVTVLIFPLMSITAQDLTVEFKPTLIHADYNDVVFAGESIILECKATDVSNISLYLNDKQLQFQSSVVSLKLILNMVKVTEAGNYTCVAQVQSVIVTDHFVLNVVLDWPHCISKCDNGEFEYLCYTRSFEFYQMSWENSLDGENFQTFTHFTMMNRGTRLIGVSNEGALNHDDNNAYKCIYKNQLTTTMCNFPSPSTIVCNTPSATSNIKISAWTSMPYMKADTERINNANVTTTEQGITILEDTKAMPYVTLAASPEEISEDSQSIEGLLIVTGISIGAIMCLFVITTCFLISSRSRKSRNIDKNEKRTTRRENAGTLSSTSFINVPINSYTEDRIIDFEADMEMNDAIFVDEGEENRVEQVIKSHGYDGMQDNTNQVPNRQIDHEQIVRNDISALDASECSNKYDVKKGEEKVSGDGDYSSINLSNSIIGWKDSKEHLQLQDSDVNPYASIKHTKSDGAARNNVKSHYAGFGRNIVSSKSNDQFVDEPKTLATNTPMGGSTNVDHDYASIKKLKCPEITSVVVASDEMKTLPNNCSNDLATQPSKSVIFTPDTKSQQSDGAIGGDKHLMEDNTGISGRGYDEKDYASMHKTKHQEESRKSRKKGSGSYAPNVPVLESTASGENSHGSTNDGHGYSENEYASIKKLNLSRKGNKERQLTDHQYDEPLVFSPKRTAGLKSDHDNGEMVNHARTNADNDYTSIQTIKSTKDVQPYDCLPGNSHTYETTEMDGERSELGNSNEVGLHSTTINGNYASFNGEQIPETDNEAARVIDHQYDEPPMSSTHLSERDSMVLSGELSEIDQSMVTATTALSDVLNDGCAGGYDGNDIIESIGSSARVNEDRPASHQYDEPPTHLSEVMSQPNVLGGELSEVDQSMVAVPNVPKSMLNGDEEVDYEREIFGSDYASTMSTKATEGENVDRPSSHQYDDPPMSANHLSDPLLSTKPVLDDILDGVGLDCVGNDYASIKRTKGTERESRDWPTSHQCDEPPMSTTLPTEVETDAELVTDTSECISGNDGRNYGVPREATSEHRAERIDDCYQEIAEDVIYYVLEPTAD